MPAPVLPPKPPNGWDALLNRVSARVSPTLAEADEERTFAEHVMAKLAPSVPEARIVFVGSAARDTGLRGDRDVDVFVAFPRAFERDEIVKRTVAAAKKAVPVQWEMHYAEHPYMQAKVGNYKVEVIPCFQTQPHEKLKSAVDRSILHMDYLQQRLTKDQRRDVRCLKQLLRTAGIYGAEVEVQGFSGLVCEQLILNYRSLHGLLHAASQWRLPAFIDVEDAYPDAGDRAALLEKFNAPLVLIDAVDRNRNAAAAVNETNVSKFIALARAVVRNPSERWFFPSAAVAPANARKGITALLKKRGTHALLLRIPKPAGVVDDILYPQLYKLEKILRAHVQQNEFPLVDTTAFATRDAACVLLELAALQAPRVKRVLGPPVDNARAVESFLKKKRAWLRGPFVDGKRVVAEKTRDTTDALELLDAFRKVPRLFGVPSTLLPKMEDAKIVTGGKFTDDESLRAHAFLTKKDAFLG